MTYLLDTNVVCEATSRHPDARVRTWCEEHARESVLSCITLGEIWKGIHLLPAGKRRDSLAAWATALELDFADLVLPLDSPTLKLWGEFYAGHGANGLHLGTLDSLIAATALRHQLVVVTRNLKDFPPGVPTYNPWES